MAYENVDVTRAKNAINQCLNSINHTASSDLLSSLSGSTNWVADSKKNFSNAVDTLVNTRYRELEAYLKKCLTNLDNIEKVQQMQSQNASYSNQISAKEQELRTMNSKYNAMADKSTYEAQTLKNKIERTKTEIRDLNNKKSNNDSSLSNVNRSIDI